VIFASPLGVAALPTPVEILLMIAPVAALRTYRKPTPLPVGELLTSGLLLKVPLS
jgi:hypothetical protein